ncbi:ABC transporter permease [Hydrotalea sandarakina]|uniref:Lipoprotein-releasing system permease protein n=1 Tax=Hydrotalea sandarakina TaxID=1004304 RepID=A0A2W7S0X1_9BACT|nr:FtsX-like permease family protein [Hydrotalea sandarakina]PZX64606.1 lipoprotein-releasing system permease protein [Hydrotalea sandarakina]
MNFLFARRYFTSKKSTNAITLIAWISISAIMVGTAALIIVLSVFNGFEDLVKGLYADFYADLRITPQVGKTFVLTPKQIQQIQNTGGVAFYSLTAEEKALLVNGDNQSIVFVKGVDSSFTHVNPVQTHLIRGSFNLGTLQKPQLVVGAGIENALGLDVEKSLYPVTLYMPNRQSANMLSAEGLYSYNAMPAGTFMIQEDFDNKYVFTNLAFVKYMLNMDANTFSAVEIKLTKNANTQQVQTELQHLLGNSFKVQTRYQQNESLYTVMEVEKWVIYGILSIILIIAAFNMIGALTMLVLEKQKDITVLKALGASDGLIQKIFLTEGFLLAAVGGGAGMILALIICYIQIKFHLVSLGGGTFIIDYYPVKLALGDFVLVIATVFVIALLAAWFPAFKAGKEKLSLRS